MSESPPASSATPPPAVAATASAAASSGRLGALLVIAAAASWGTWSLFLRPSQLPAAFTAPVMFLVMGLSALPLALCAPPAQWDRRARWLLFGNGACDALNVLCFFAAMDHTSVAVAVLTHYATPVLVALTAPWIDRERNPAALAAAILAMAGLTLVLEPWQSGGGFGWGAVLGLASAVCYAGNVFIVRRLAAVIGAARAISYHGLIAGVLLAPMLLTVPMEQVTWSGVGLLVAGGVTIGAGAGIVYAFGLVRTGASRAGVLTFAEPLVAVLVGILVWGEPATLAMSLGGAMVLAAGVWVVRGAAASAASAASAAPPSAASSGSPKQ